MWRAAGGTRGPAPAPALVMLVHEGCRRVEDAELRETLCFENDTGDVCWAAGWARVALGDHSEPGRQTGLTRSAVHTRALESEAWLGRKRSKERWSKYDVP